MENLDQKMLRYDTAIDSVRADMNLQAQQRSDDLDLLERAMTQLQNHTKRVRDVSDSALVALRKDFERLEKTVGKGDVVTSTHKMELAEIRRKLLEQQRDAQRRFDNLNKCMKAVADAIHMAPTLTSMLTEVSERENS